jgi:mannosyltransferase
LLTVVKYTFSMPQPSAHQRKLLRVDVVNAVMAVVAVILAIPALSRDMFFDEAVTLHFARLPWSALAKEVHYQDLVLAPYYVLMHVWLWGSGSVIWLRLPSLLAYGAVIFFTGRLGNRLAGSWCGVSAALLVATNPLFVEASVYARPYALSTLAVVLAASSLLRWEQTGQRISLWWWCIWTLFAAGLNVFATLVPLGLFALLVLLRWNKMAKGAILLPGLLATALTGAWLLLTSREAAQISWIPTMSLHSAAIGILGPLYMQRHIYMYVVALVVVTVWLVMGWRMLRARRLDSSESAMAVLGAYWAFGPSVLLVVASFVHSVFIFRYVTMSAPGLSLLAAYGIA